MPTTHARAAPIGGRFRRSAQTRRRDRGLTPRGLPEEAAARLTPPQFQMPLRANAYCRLAMSRRFAGPPGLMIDTESNIVTEYL